MAIKNWSTSYPTSQDDPVTTNQPTLVDASDETRVSQIHTMRDKLGSVAVIVGDNSALPAGCIRANVATLAAQQLWSRLWHLDTEESATGIGLTLIKHGVLYLPSISPKPATLQVGCRGWVFDPATTGHIVVTIYKGVFSRVFSCYPSTSTPTLYEGQLTWGESVDPGAYDITVEMENDTGGELSYLDMVSVAMINPEVTL